MDEGDYPYSYNPNSLTAIYFGCIMPDDQKKQIAGMPAKSAARLYDMKKSK
jgi:hypothetical protein